MSENSTSENQLGTEPIDRLLVRMSLPMIISFFIQALYNIVDSIFVSRISENALTAVSLAFPMQMAAHAIAVGLSVGLNARVPEAIGAKDKIRANRIAGTAIFLSFVSMLVFMAAGFLFTTAIYQHQTDVAEIIDGGSVYLRILWTVSAGEFFGQLLEKMLLCAGCPLSAMLSQACGAVFNIIFDPLLIFGIGIFPRLGINGAAWATVGGQIVAALLALIMNLKHNHLIHLQPSDFIPDISSCKDVLSVGFPSMVTIGLSSLSNYLINQILLSYSTTATAVYGIWAKLQNFCYMPVFGMNNGMVPILSYNLSAHHPDRVKKTFHMAWVFILLLQVCLMVILECIPASLLSLFDASESMKAIGIQALHICLLSLPFGSMTIIMTTAMQSLRHSHYALIANILRQFINLYFFTVLLSALTHDLSIVWRAVPISELASFITAFFLMRSMFNHLHLSEDNAHRF